MPVDYKARQRLIDRFKKEAEDIQTDASTDIAKDIIDIVSYVSELESVIFQLLVQGRLKDIEIWKVYNKKD